MSGAELARALLDAINTDAHPAAGRTFQGVFSSADRPNQLATVDSAYSGIGAAKVLFDGETVMGSRGYVALSPISAGQRVMLAPLGSSYVILGAISGSAALPTGSLIEGLWATAPAGFALLDGSLLLRTDYSALFAVLGTTYNTGAETALQFRLPDMRGRVAVGVTPTGTFAGIGTRGGEEAHVLSIGEMPSHYHTFPAQANISSGGAYTAPIMNAGSLVFTSSSGGSLAHNNLQPFVVVNRAIKY